MPSPAIGDRVRLSSRSPLDADRRLASLAETTPPTPASQTPPSSKSDDASRSGSESDSKTPTNPTELSEDQKEQVVELERRDAEVRAHEQAHLAAAGPLAQGGPQFTYETGPDGKRYATGGEVRIAMRSGSTPEETIRNAARVQAAALAPGDPSPTDQQTAAAAGRAAQQARQDGAASPESQPRNGSPEATPIEA